MKIEVDGTDFFNNEDIRNLQEIASEYYKTPFPKELVSDIEYLAAWSDTRCSMLKGQRDKVSPSRRNADRALESLENTSRKLSSLMEENRDIILDNFRYNAVAMAYACENTKTVIEMVKDFDEQLSEAQKVIKDLSKIFEGVRKTIKKRAPVLKKSGGNKIDERSYLASCLMTTFDRYHFEPTDEIILKVLIICLNAAGIEFKFISDYSFSKLEEAVIKGRKVYEVNKSTHHQAFFGVKYPFTEK